MFTLNLKEIELDPRINEDKSFQNEDEIDLEDEVLKYITDTYSEVYKNPLTIGRKIREAMRDGAGKNSEDRTKAYGDEFERESKELAEKRRVAQAAADEEFEPKNEELRQLKSKESDRIREEYTTKMAATQDPDEQKALDEERKVKLEDLSYEYDQKLEALVKERSARVHALEEHGEK